ncbi:SCP2 sterol-binding domain-containing protein [Mycobacteroides franklinii]|uniref:SCP-2 sterol transfer family protein n=1 Tax=Mycobacteroides franklinii TaxID=948102 RepID=A0A4R5PDK9_9MYCO|nr:SCP2 sterol-binding domain-containing protein [Mycobacteroides franklinii]ORA63153.1 sterol carrier protein [Mycobacteroides franklinii]TDH22877.1 sterol carrier protein [Mycobacteroides franklinii]TDZ44006.1 SCP-2 sterol transfer family protein [Mycobacteroides franklinii]TDZ51140.1 SCP-2 sterol transfer family protein [Mycobacteroides franklinii]TDZ57560.1 SCP-2 sterol transfer family protein [Mycobacteroides franklinii]
MGFSDSAEVARYIGGIFETAFDDPEIGPKLVGTGLVVAFDFTEPDAVVVIDMANKSVREGLDGGSAPSATMSMTADLGSAYWQGKVNLPLAMAKKKIKVEGNVASLLKLAPLGKKLYPSYIERLKADGRDDLLV